MFHGTLKVGFVHVVMLAALGLTTVREQNSPVKNIVLVHGAWADGSGWRGVDDILVKDGYNVSLVQEPETVGALGTVARLDTLLSIMSRLDDTCLLYRGGEEALVTAKEGATVVMNAGGSGTSLGKERLERLDHQLLEMRVSPGGSGDLLAATLFLDAIERGQEEMEADRSELEDIYGAYRT